MRIQFYNQSAFLLETASGFSVAVDPGYEVAAEVVATWKPAAVFVSHKHPDHLHAPHLGTLGAPVYAPRDVLDDLSPMPGLPHVVHDGVEVVLSDLVVSCFHADHGSNLSAPVESLGFAFFADGRRLLFLGDMAVSSMLPAGDWDLVLVPVGGSKVFTPQAAADFVREIGHHGRVVPIHFHGRADRDSGERFRKLTEGVCEVLLVNVGQAIEV